MARRFDVAVMHDFYVDRLVHVGSLGGLTEVISAKAAEGGGGIHGSFQEEVRGGNAVNLAHALARLGLRTLLITHSDESHEHLLRQTFDGLKAELRIKRRPAALTVAFEEEVNVMLGDGKGASDFGPSLLEDSDWEALKGSKVVCSMNWAANRRGTELLLALRRRLGPEKPIFFDPADFRDNPQGFTKLLKLMAERHTIDWLSMNEQEAMTAAGALGMGVGNPADACLGIARRLGVVFDLHGSRKSYTSEGTRVAEAKVEKVRAKRLTGAGDVWDAGAIFGRLRGMDEVPRLEFANRVARMYLQSKELTPPTLEEALRAGA